MAEVEHALGSGEGVVERHVAVPRLTASCQPTKSSDGRPSVRTRQIQSPP
jgi:hypothetical protein